MESSSKAEKLVDVIIVGNEEYIYNGKLTDTTLGSVSLLSKGDDEFVMKMSVPMKFHKSENPRSEIELLQTLNHENIIKLVQSEERNGVIKSIFPKYKIDFFEFFSKSKLEGKERLMMVKKSFFKIGEAIKHIHDRHIYHGDISLENMLLDDDNAVLIDFCMSGVLYPSTAYTEKSIGKPCYVTKECTRGYHNPFKTDVWCFGMSIYMGLLNQRIYDSCNDASYDVLIKKKFSGYMNILRKKGASILLDKTAMNFFEKIFTEEVQIPSIGQVLQDPFFDDVRSPCTPCSPCTPV